MKKLFFLLFLIIIILLIKSFFFRITTPKTLQHYSENWNYPVQVELHKLYLPKDKVNIVMLGDSHTYRVNWNELLSDNTIINRGIDGDTTAGFLARLELILKLKPKYIYLLGGYNDFRKGYDVKSVFHNFELIIKQIKLKNIVPVIYATLYDSSGRYEEKIYKLNSLLRKYCDFHNIKFIDLNKQLSSNKKLLEKYSYDGIHLNAKGYDIWRESSHKFNISLEGIK